MFLMPPGRAHDERFRHPTEQIQLLHAQFSRDSCLAVTRFESEVLYIVDWTLDCPSGILLTWGEIRDFLGLLQPLTEEVGVCRIDLTHA
jgi:hypothetical protein